MEVAPELHTLCNNQEGMCALQQWKKGTCVEEENLHVLQLLEMKRNNRDVVVAPREEDAPTMHDSIFNPNKTYCLGWF